MQCSYTVVGRVIGDVSSWQRQCVPCWSAWSWVEQTSVSPECCSTAHILREEARSCIATTALAAGATAYWIQDCCACLPVSSQTSSGVYVFRATECEGPTIKATTTIVVVTLPSHSDIATVNRWWSCFSSLCHKSLECSVSSLSVIPFCSLPPFKHWLKTELFLHDLTNLFFICGLPAWLSLSFVSWSCSISLCLDRLWII